jgi:hypothetical protein
MGLVTMVERAPERKRERRRYKKHVVYYRHFIAKERIRKLLDRYEGLWRAIASHPFVPLPKLDPDNVVYMECKLMNIIYYMRYAMKAKDETIRNKLGIGDWQLRTLIVRYTWYPGMTE